MFTQEANQECEEVMVKKSFFINASGSLIRKIGKEAMQTFFVLTKEPFGEYRALTNMEKRYFLSLKKEDLTFTNFVKWFGDTSDVTSGRTTIVKKSMYNVCDTLTLTSSEFPLIKSSQPVKTTLGRLIFYKVLAESLGFNNIVEFNNVVMTKGNFGAFENAISNALKSDQITSQQMVEYIDTRDWFGLQVHGLITTSFTPNTVKVPQRVKDLKKQLMEQHKSELEAGNEKVIENIEKILIAEIMKEFKGDVGLDLYISGARGSVDNHLKNILLTRGAIKNPVTKKFDIITNSLMDGLEKKDIAAHSNMITSGAFPKAVKILAA